MHLDRLWLTNFRNYAAAELEFPSDGLTMITGRNGHGKTNLIEAIGYVASGRSFRATAPDVMVRRDAEQAIVRGQGVRAQRELLVEAEIATAGRSRTLVNRQPVRRSRDLAETFLATVFSPDDLDLVKGGPASRRRYLDDVLADGDQRAAALQRDADRILRQRNTLLRQAGGRSTPDIALTLDVWDAKFSQVGEELGRARQALVERLQPLVQAAYAELAQPEEGSSSARVGMRMVTDWREEDGGKGLMATLTAVRSTDLARGVTTAGPHRDELELSVNGMPSRTHASQGEQRTLALSLRLAAHRVLGEVAGASPLLLLDDVFSELDEERSRALVAQLPPGQAFLSTATKPPRGISPALTLSVVDGFVIPVSADQ